MEEELDWSVKNVPRSVRFGDLYFSDLDGLDETKYVFLDGNKLPEIWRCTDRFIIAETGFGTGLNFFATWQLWRETSTPNSNLIYYSIEKYPLTISQIAKSISRWPDLKPLLEEFKKRLEEQDERHQGGSKWVGTEGTSPFGNAGENPEGIRVGGEGGKGKAAKVWEARDFKNLDDNVELGTRNMKVALRRLRKLIRDSAQEEFDLDGTISETARKAGMLDVMFRPEKRNAVKVLALFDVGGSMDPHIKVCEELFSACKTEFKNLEYFYFHNFLYESVWTKSHRRHAETTSTFELINKFSKDYNVIFVGDATMAPYEVTHIGGSIEHYNEEAATVGIKRISDAFDHVVWINPTPRDYWEHSYSIEIVKELTEDRMFPLTVKGLEEAMSLLTK